jgi:hypothetical protein
MSTGDENKNDSSANQVGGNDQDDDDHDCHSVD